MRSKSLLAALALALVSVSVLGCSSGPPKSGIPLQADDYKYAPGGKPMPGAATAAINPNKR